MSKKKVKPRHMYVRGTPIQPVEVEQGGEEVKGQTNGALMGVLGVLGILFIAVLFVGLWAMGMYNSMVTASAGVDAQFANVDSVYQRRADLIPNLVESVKGYMAYEGKTLTAVTEARSAWAKAGTVDEKIAAGTSMDSAISRLLVTMEAYPQLKASESTNKLMDELAGTENRISVERMRYNEVVKSYNTMIKYFPGSVIANMGGFREKPYFEAQAGSENAPKVKFD